MNSSSAEHRILHLVGSPRGARSASRAAAEYYIEEVREHRPAVDVLTREVWSGLPSFDGPALDAKYARLTGRTLDDEELRAWSVIDRLIDEVRQASAIVISTPMWNFGIPYRLKQWFDLVTQPGLSFSFEPGIGYRPLLSPRPVLCILSSAGDYRTGTSFGRPDLASGYLTAALQFIGLGPVSIVPVGPTAGAAEAVQEAQERARGTLQALAWRSLKKPT